MVNSNTWNREDFRNSISSLLSHGVGKSKGQHDQIGHCWGTGNKNR